MLNKISLKLLAICVLMILFISTTPANAERWSKQYHVDYTLGDNDNRTEARKIAINKLRMMAAADAGKYIQGDEVLVDDKYASGIHMATAAIVSIRDSKEATTINDAGQTVLHLTATAMVDDGVLKKRIAAIRKNAALAARLADEDARVAALFERMAELNGNLAAARETAKMYRLMGERVRVEADIQSVFGQSRKEFAPGELKGIATRYAIVQKKQAVEREKAEKHAQAEIDIRDTEKKIIRESTAQKRIAWLQQRFYQPFMENTTLDATIENVVTAKGGGYDITAGLAWDTHLQCPVFHLKKNKMTAFREKHPVTSFVVGFPLAFVAASVALAVDIGTLGAFHASEKFRHINDDHKDKQLKAWKNDPETRKNVLFSMGGCADGIEHTSLAFVYAKTHGMELSNDPAAQYLHRHHVVIKLTLAPGHEHVKSIPVFDGSFFYSKNPQYSRFQFHVSADEINAIQEIEATMKVKRL